MKILVCIKRTPETGEINRYDTFALEEALCIKEQMQDKDKEPVSVDVVTAGSNKTTGIIRRAFGMGADRGYHLVTGDIKFVPAMETAFCLALVAKNSSYDLILTGLMSEDMMDGQTGPIMAEIMGIPCVTGVVQTSLVTDDHFMPVVREMEGGLKESMEVRLPALLTIQSGINTPRYPTLSNMLTAGKKKITTLSVPTCSVEPAMACESFIGLTHPEKIREGRVLGGSLADKACELLAMIKEKELL